MSIVCHTDFPCRIFSNHLNFRFHILAEFDDGKRSCRKRLAGHNKRRRKPQLDTHFGKLLIQLEQYLILLYPKRKRIFTYISNQFCLRTNCC